MDMDTGESANIKLFFKPYLLEENRNKSYQMEIYE